MTIIATRQRRQKDPIVNVMLNGGRVTCGFRAALFAAANRAGVSVNEFVITAAAEKLRASGSQFSGVFEPGDIGEKRCMNQKRTRKKLKKLEQQFDQLFELVCKLANHQQDFTNSITTISDAVGDAMEIHVATVAANRERDEAAQNGLSVNH